MIALLGAVLLTATICSPNGEVCLAIRNDPPPRDLIAEWLDAYPLQGTEPDAEQPEPVRGVLYRPLPSGYQHVIAELAFKEGEEDDRALLANDGTLVTYQSIHCRADAELLAIRAPDGSPVHTIAVSDVFTKNDQQWLCRGLEDDVRWSLNDDQLRATILVTDGKWDDTEARHEAVDIDLATGTIETLDGDRCPAPLVVAVEPIDGLLDRAVVRVMPVYPEVAEKARIAGRVRVDIVVGEDGRVKTARVVQPLPFGIDAAVKAAIAKWEFAPASTSYSGSFAFHFEIIRPRRVVTTSCG